MIGGISFERSSGLTGFPNLSGLLKQQRRRQGCGVGQFRGESELLTLLESLDRALNLFHLWSSEVFFCQ